jgi:hypothetical protein
MKDFEYYINFPTHISSVFVLKKISSVFAFEEFSDVCAELLHESVITWFRFFLSIFEHMLPYIYLIWFKI